jgi:hypothetical protein
MYSGHKLSKPKQYRCVFKKIKDVGWGQTTCLAFSKTWVRSLLPPKKKKNKNTQMWCTPVIPALRNQEGGGAGDQS